MNSRQGITLVETVVLVVMAIATLGVLIPLVQSNREAARMTVCEDNLGLLATAATEYDELNGRLPVHIGLLAKQDSDCTDGFDYIRDHQTTNPNSMLLGLLGYQSLVDLVDPLAFDSELTLDDGGYVTFGQWLSDGIDAIIYRHEILSIPEYLCPADVKAQNDRGLLASFVTDNGCVGTLSLPETVTTYLLTNYVTNAGAFGVTTEPTNPDWQGLWGPVRSRDSDSVEKIADGASNVVMFGESLGYILSGSFDHRYLLASGGLAIGRADEYNLPTIFGDAVETRFYQFSSAHPETVNVVLADGSVRRVSRNIHPETFGRMCAAADGLPFFSLND